MDELVTELSFDDRLSDALVSHEGPEGAVLDATLAYERGAFDDAAFTRAPTCWPTPTRRRCAGATSSLPRPDQDALVISHL